jgi:hypothetical protein
MANKITVALAGLGSRGKDTYAKAIRIRLRLLRLQMSIRKKWKW